MSMNAKRFERLLEAVPDALVGMDQEGVIRFVNSQTESLFGYDRDELIGQPIDTLVPETRLQISADHKQDRFADPRTRSSGLDLELSGRHRNGGEFPINVSISHIDTGDALLVITAAGDVAARQQAPDRSSQRAGRAPTEDAGLEAVLDATRQLLGITTPAEAADVARNLITALGGQIVPAAGAPSSEALPLDVSFGQGMPLVPLAPPLSVARLLLERHLPSFMLDAQQALAQVEKAGALAEVSRRYRLLAENASDLVVMTSPDRVITWVSPSLTASLGWAVEDLMGTRLLDLVHPDDAAATEGPREAVYSGFEVCPPSGGFLMRFRTKSGLYRWMAGVATPVTDESGVFTGVVSALRDVDDLVRAREAAESDRATLRATLDSLMDPHVVLEAVRDDCGQIVDFAVADANPAACAYLGVAHEDLAGSRLLERYPGVVGAGLLEQYAQVVETGEPLRLDDLVYPVETMGGQERHLDISAARVGDGLSYTWRDVTDPHVVAARLAQWQDLHRLLAENASDVVFMANSDRRIVWIAPSVTAVLGWDPEELVGTQFADLLRPDYKIATVLDRVELYTKGHDVGPEGGFLFELRTKSGDYRWVSGHEHALTEPDGTPVGVVAGLRDVTDLVKDRGEAQELSSALQTSNDSLRDFVAVASHDLRSPLVTIGGFTKILTDNWATLSDEDRLKQLDAIRRGVERLSRLTNDLLTSAKVEAAAEPDQPEQTQPEHIRLATALASYLEANPEELSTVAVTCPPELVAVVDPSHLTRILDNYLTNAFKYGQPPVRIEAEQVGDFVEVRVRDHGPGVPPEFVPRLFTKFDRADTPATRATQGTGLGLSIVKALAEANHGNASYQHDQPNDGCFVVRLPAGAA